MTLSRRGWSRTPTFSSAASIYPSSTSPKTGPLPCVPTCPLWASAASSAPTTPTVSREAAGATVAGHLAGLDVTRWETPQLVIVPLATGDREAAAGQGYAYRLAWTIGAAVEGSQGSWEALVDARSGELLAFYDTNSYVDQKKVVGGIFPVSNDGLSPGGVPDGTEQPGFPMSRAYVFQGATQLTANSEGLVTVDGEYRTSLTGPFVRIQDNCGVANEVTSCDTLDLATSAGTDCARPPGHSLGDTHSARTGFSGATASTPTTTPRASACPARPTQTWRPFSA